MYERLRVNVKVERGLTFTFTRDLPYIASNLFTHVIFTRVRTYRIRRQWKSTLRLVCTHDARTSNMRPYTDSAACWQSLILFPYGKYLKILTMLASYCIIPKPYLLGKHFKIYQELSDCYHRERNARSPFVIYVISTLHWKLWFYLNQMTVSKTE